MHNEGIYIQILRMESSFSRDSHVTGFTEVVYFRYLRGINDSFRNCVANQRSWNRQHYASNYFFSSQASHIMTLLLSDALICDVTFMHCG